MSAAAASPSHGNGQANVFLCSRQRDCEMSPFLVSISQPPLMSCTRIGLLRGAAAGSSRCAKAWCSRFCLPLTRGCMYVRAHFAFPPLPLVRDCSHLGIKLVVVCHVRYHITAIFDDPGPANWHRGCGRVEETRRRRPTPVLPAFRRRPTSVRQSGSDVCLFFSYHSQL